MTKVDNITKDLEYLEIVSNIIENKKFQKTKECKHHGITRYEHSLRVSYYSYLVTKKLRLNYIETAKGSLLHDFFIKDDLKEIEQKLSMFVHPYYSIKNAKYYFDLTDLEKDIIINHMFPTLPHKIPKYLESWIVSLVDKVVATYEFYCSYGKTFMYSYSNLYILLLLSRF